MNWGPQSESHLVGVNSVAILVCIDGGQGGRHSKGNQRDGQRVNQNPGQLSQVREARLGESGERGIQDEDGLVLRRIWGRQRKQGGVGQGEVLGGKNGRRAGSRFPYPPGNSPTIWTLYLVSREEVKQSTEARSTWEREQIRAWQEMGFLAETRKSLTEKKDSKATVSCFWRPSPWGLWDVFGLGAWPPI